MIKGFIFIFLSFALPNVWANEEIKWREWSAITFAKAKAENRLILINVGHEGCTACRFMEENTFSNPDVIE